jgi:hypothetical protein
MLEPFVQGDWQVAFNYFETGEAAEIGVDRLTTTVRSGWLGNHISRSSSRGWMCVVA